MRSREKWGVEGRQRAEGEVWGVRGEVLRRIWDEGCVVVFDSHLQKKKKNTKGRIWRSRVMEGRTGRRWVGGWWGCLRTRKLQVYWVNNSWFTVDGSCFSWSQLHKACGFRQTHASSVLNYSVIDCSAWKKKRWINSHFDAKMLTRTEWLNRSPENQTDTRPAKCDDRFSGAANNAISGNYHILVVKVEQNDFRQFIYLFIYLFFICFKMAQIRLKERVLMLFITAPFDWRSQWKVDRTWPEGKSGEKKRAVW